MSLFANDVFVLKVAADVSRGLRAGVVSFLCAALMCVTLSGCESGSRDDRLQSALDKFAATNPNIPGIVVVLHSDRLGLHWEGVSGVAEKRSGEPIRSGHVVRLASTTKTYVAAAILRLYEEGKVNLDTPLSAMLPSSALVILETGDYQPEKITVRHLLLHTSGLRDFVGPSYAEAILADPQREWSREEQLEWAMKEGPPIGPPGAQYMYSDTGYILLGTIIEQQSGMSLGLSLRTLLKFDDLGLDVTRIEEATAGHAPESARAHQYYGDIDTTAWNPSFDLFGGGGVVATMPELARFFQALFEGEVYESSDTLDVMLDPLAPGASGAHRGEIYGRPIQYCLGIYAGEHKGMITYEHGGFWGILGGYVPDLGLSFGLSVSQNLPERMQRDLLEELLDVVVNE